MSTERLQKVLAGAGIASRRACEKMVLDGRVTVNGDVVSDLPAFVDTKSDIIRVDGRKIKVQAKVYLMLNKPKGVVSTAKDPGGRKTVVDIVGNPSLRLFPVGRLDRDSQGLVLLTNDGELTKLLTHPRYDVEKVYQVEVAGKIEGSVCQRLLDGVYLSEGRARAKRVRIVRRGASRSVLQVTLTEGRNRQVRRMLAKVSVRVRKLTRIKMGPLVLKGVKAGHFRPLTKRELSQLQESVQLA